MKTVLLSHLPTFNSWRGSRFSLAAFLSALADLGRPSLNHSPFTQWRMILQSLELPRVSWKGSIIAGCSCFCRYHKRAFRFGCVHRHVDEMLFSPKCKSLEVSSYLAYKISLNFCQAHCFQWSKSFLTASITWLLLFRITALVGWGIPDWTGPTAAFPLS